MQYKSCYEKRKMAIVFQGMEIIGEKRCNHLFLPWQDFVVLSIRKGSKPICFVRRNSCWSTETNCKKQKHDLNQHKLGWMSGKNGQIKENSTLNWRSTSRKISIKSAKDGFFYNFVENIIKKIVWSLLHFKIFGHPWYF